MGGSVGGISFEHNLYWESLPQANGIGGISRGMDGTPIAWVVTPAVDPAIGLHTFRFAWEEHDTIESVRDLAGAGTEITLSCGDGVSVRGFIPPDAKIDAVPQPSPGTNEEFAHGNQSGTQLDIYSGSFEFFVTSL